jgi:hypothetical protein
LRGITEPFVPPDKVFLLEEPRDWQETEKIMDRLRINPGDIIADIGGWFRLFHCSTSVKGW